MSGAALKLGIFHMQSVGNIGQCSAYIELRFRAGLLVTFQKARQQRYIYFLEFIER